MMAGSEEGYIQKVFLKSPEHDTGSGEVALYLIANASNCFNIAYKVKDNLMDNKRSHNGHPNLYKLVGNVGVL